MEWDVTNYIIGNPPFQGYSIQSKEQKDDVLSVYVDEKGKPYKTAGKIDYVACWYMKAAELMSRYSGPADGAPKTAFVSTNSICQGEQVSSVWRPLMERYGIQIDFAHRTFRWDSESTLKAHVHCVIVGFSCQRAGNSSSLMHASRMRSDTSNTPATPEWHSRGYIPHCENQSVQFITYRLADSVPHDIISAWKQELEIQETTDTNDPKCQELRKRIDKYEDAGYGECHLKNDRIATMVEDNMLRYDGELYHLIDWCIMPNHVHVLIEVIEGHTLSEIMHRWRSYTAHEANKILGRTGDFWQKEYFDRYIRDNAHLHAVMDYIDNNPTKAGIEARSARSHNYAGEVRALQNNAGTSRSLQNIAGEPPALRQIFDNGKIFNASHINTYLMDAPDVWIESRNKALCDVPQMIYGNKPADGGHLFLTQEEHDELFASWSCAEKYVRPFVGADEFINNRPRYCLWLKGASPDDLRRSSEVMRRIEGVRQMRLASPKEATRHCADTPTLFQEDRQPSSHYIIVPCHSSERRRYIPLGYVSSDVVCGNANLMIPDATLYHFGVLMSNVHMAWMRAVCGRLKSDYRYSKDIVYNNFPWPCRSAGGSPAIDGQSSRMHSDIERTAQAILDARALYPKSSLADLYDELSMPPELRKAHQDNDRAVMQAYGFDIKTTTETSCVAELFKLYQKLTQNQDTATHNS